jgi:hypothetical protein
VASEQDIQAARRLQGKLMADIDTAAIPFIADAIAQARQEGEAAGFRRGVEVAVECCRDSVEAPTWHEREIREDIERSLRALLPPDTATITTEAGE